MYTKPCFMNMSNSAPGRYARPVRGPSSNRHQPESQGKGYHPAPEQHLVRTILGLLLLVHDRGAPSQTAHWKRSSGGVTAPLPRVQDLASLRSLCRLAGRSARFSNYQPTAERFFLIARFCPRVKLASPYLRERKLVGAAGIERTNENAKACALKALQPHVPANRYKRNKASIRPTPEAWKV